MPTLPACRRHDMSDDAWLVLEFILAAVLPPAKGAGRPRKWPLRLLIDGIRWRARAGAPWRDLPAEYGPWQSAYGLFRKWQLDGTWAAVVTALQALADAAGDVTWDVSVDSGTARAHQHAAGARKDGAAQKEPPGPEPADHGLGRPRTRPDRVLADKAYGSRANRGYLRRRGIRCTIPEQKDRVAARKRRGSSGGRPWAFDQEKYKQRHVRCHQPAQAQPRRRHPIRQARRPLRSHHPRRLNRRMAPTPHFLDTP